MSTQLYRKPTSTNEFRWNSGEYVAVQRMLESIKGSKDVVVVAHEKDGLEGTLDNTNGQPREEEGEEVVVVGVEGTPHDTVIL